MPKNSFLQRCIQMYVSHKSARRHEICLVASPPEKHIHNRRGGISRIRHVCHFCGGGGQAGSQPIWRRLLSTQSSSISSATFKWKVVHSSTQWDGTHASPTIYHHINSWPYLYRGDIYRWQCTQMIYLFICLLPNAKMTQLPRYRTRTSTSPWQY